MGDAAIGKFPFGDGGELFDTALKYASWKTPSYVAIRSTKFSKLIFS